jgi:methylase of polypeptide subunit release factors
VDFAGLHLEHPVGTYEPFAPMLGVVRSAVAYAPEHARILDVGCGVGSIALAVARRRPDVSILGIDINLGALRAARRNAAKHSISNARFVACDLYECLRPLCFDVITNTLPYEAPSSYDMKDLEEVPHAYADDRQVFGRSLAFGVAQAPMLVLFGLEGFRDVLLSMSFEVLSAVPDNLGNVTFVAKQR